MEKLFSELEPREIAVDSNRYNVLIKRGVVKDSRSTKLIIISFLPNELTRGILEVCIRSIKEYTPEEHELWVVDNNSPEESVKWLAAIKGINIIFNRSRYVDNGSYDNAIGLELATRIIDKESRYIMALHQDIMVCKTGWLSNMLSKIDGNVKAVGVRLDKYRVSECILHVLGYIIDFQIFKKLKLSFLPQLPNYDVGDLAIYNLTKSGYGIYAFPNSLHEPELLHNIPDSSPFKTIYMDRTFDENKEIFFLHMGRGVIKSEGKGAFEGKTLPEEWIDFGKQYILKESSNMAINAVTIDPCFKDLSYSVRRYFIDDFFARKVMKFGKDGRILDMGGKKKNKRGQFNLDNYDLAVEYANIDKKTEPDFLCNISKIPVPDNTYDGIICSEVLEHVKKPEDVIKEAYRTLKPGSILLLCVPFMCHIHADPYDYGRYTDYFWEVVLSEAGFTDIEIEKQGLFFNVLANMIKLFAYEMQKEGKPKNILLRKIFHKIVFWGVGKASALEQRPSFSQHDFFKKYTTGFGISAVKKRGNNRYLNV